MQQLGAIASFGFQGMGESMAEIEQGAIALFLFVGRDDGGFGLATDGDGLARGIGKAFQAPGIDRAAVRAMLTEAAV